MTDMLPKELHADRYRFAVHFDMAGDHDVLEVWADNPGEAEVIARDEAIGKKAYRNVRGVFADRDWVAVKLKDGRTMLKKQYLDALSEAGCLEAMGDAA